MQWGTAYKKCCFLGMKLLSLEMDHKYASLIKAIAGKVQINIIKPDIYKTLWRFRHFGCFFLDFRHRPGLSRFFHLVRRTQKILQIEMGAGTSSECNKSTVRHHQRRRATRNG